MRRMLAILACASLTACWSSSNDRFGWAHHEESPPGGAGWAVAVEDDGAVTVSVWPKAGAKVTRAGTLNAAGRSALGAAVPSDYADLPPGTSGPCTELSQAPCTSYTLRYTDADGLEDELLVGPIPALAAFVDELVADVPTGRSPYVDDFH